MLSRISPTTKMMVSSRDRSPNPAENTTARMATMSSAVRTAASGLPIFSRKASMGISRRRLFLLSPPPFPNPFIAQTEHTCHTGTGLPSHYLYYEAGYVVTFHDS